MLLTRVVVRFVYATPASKFASSPSGDLSGCNPIDSLDPKEQVMRLNRRPRRILSILLKFGVLIIALTILIGRPEGVLFSALLVVAVLMIAADIATYYAARRANK
ncbi:hypothetical protein GCM10027416_18980 [Okibacterium endophyticum]